MKLNKITTISISIVICCLFSTISLFNQNNIFSEFSEEDKNINLKNIQHKPLLSDSFYENRTEYSKQLINDSTIEESYSSTPWSDTIEEDSNDDFNTSISSEFLNYQLIGDTDSFSLDETVINNTEYTNWTAVKNPDFPAFPEWPDNGEHYDYSNPYAQTADFSDSYGIDEHGVWTNHSWYESPKQTPSVNWVENFTTDVNMTEYEIIDVDISSTVNGSCIADGGAYSGNIEVEGDTNNEATQSVTYDYVYFYVNIADLSRNIEYTLADYKTSELGLSNATLDITDIEKQMEPVILDNLKFYLSQVLAVDGHNFSLILGIDIVCEDSRSSDIDVWNMLRIKNLNFSFTYVKKIEQASFAAWEQDGYKINETSYEMNEIELISANLNFNYVYDDHWVKDSPNSEFRVVINNITHTETIKLSNGTIVPQEVLGGKGFDVLDYIDPDEPVEVQIICYIADNFNLDSNLTISIDNITLDVTYAVIEKLDAVDTTLTTQGDLTREIEWNSTFEVYVNYTELNTMTGIETANLSVSWLLENETVQIDEINQGLYKITATTENCSSNAQYPLEIVASGEIPYDSASLLIQIQVIGRLTNLNISINDKDYTSSPVFETIIGEPLNISAFYISDDVNIENANTSLFGSILTSSMYTYSSEADHYEYQIDSWELGIGTHILTLIISKENFESQSLQIRITLLERETHLALSIEKQDLLINPIYNVQYNQNFNITVGYIDQLTATHITNAIIGISGPPSGSSLIDELPDGYLIRINTSKFSLGEHYLTVSAGLDKYQNKQYLITLNVDTRATYMNVSIKDSNVSLPSEIEYAITSNFTICAGFYDNATNSLITNPQFQVQGLSTELLNISLDSGILNIYFDTLSIGLGFYPITISAQYQNYTTIIQQLDLTIRQIQTEISSEYENNSYTILPGSDLDLIIYLEDLDFNESLSNSSVRYQWEFGTGVLEYVSDGYYHVMLNSIPEGIFPITITVFQGPNYQFEQFTVTVNSIVVDDNPYSQVVVYGLSALLGGVSVSFVAYQRYFKYPKVIRKLRKIKRMMKKGKPSKITFSTPTDIFKDSYHKIIQEQGVLNFTPGSSKAKELINPLRQKVQNIKQKQNMTPSDTTRISQLREKRKNE